MIGKIVLADEAHLRRMFDGACAILGKTGMRVTHPVVLDRLEAFGAKVDKTHKHVRFSEKVIAKTLEAVRNSERQRNYTKPTFPARFEVSLGDACFFLWDHEKRTRRKATKQDFVNIIHFANAREEITHIDAPVEIRGMDVRTMVVEMLATLYLNTTLPCGVENNIPQQVKWLAELHKVAADHGRPATSGNNAQGITSPLTFGDRAAELMIQGSEYGFRGGLYTMAIAGANAPASIEACATQAAAELLGGWACVLATDPHKVFGTLVLTGTLDMRTGKACFASPGAIRQNILVAEMFKAICGIHVRANWPWYTDAVVPGYQCALERQAKILAYAAYEGAPEFHVGDLDGASVFSLEQAVLDLEMCRYVYQMLKPANMSQEQLALDEIDYIGVDPGKTHVDTDYTLKHFRENLYQPLLTPHPYWSEGMAGPSEKDVLGRAHQDWKKTLNAYEPEPRSEGLRRDIEKVMVRAREELLSAELE